jgi:hypothetical protein
MISTSAWSSTALHCIAFRHDVAFIWSINPFYHMQVQRACMHADL